MQERRSELACKRLLLRHMSDEMLDRLPEIEDAEPAEDEMRISH